MATGNDSSSPLITHPYIQKLARTAKSLNDESDRLNKAVSAVGLTLQVLNLGITSWLQVSVHEEGPLWTVEEIGYAKVKGKWGIALRRASGDQNNDDGVEEATVWPFEEGPRDFRIRGASLLPALIEKLHEDAEAAVESVARHTDRLYELAKALSLVQNAPEGGK